MTTRRVGALDNPGERDADSDRHHGRAHCVKQGVDQIVEELIAGNEINVILKGEITE